MVHSIRISDQAESTIDTLADLTGGLKTYSDGTTLAGLINAFNSLLDSATDGTCENLLFNKYHYLYNYV